ncbi:unnamed protein product [Thlaspi arvense]|uniref:ERAP1-like C-terminal domain-containing protein n=1 Tax=Thlaspi arvense TaxID=13288 RepID=A0AAU9RKJ7_THLAR|nr:unnamed protein product [Thlaspi arvense]
MKQGDVYDAFLEDRNTSLLPPDIRKAAYVAVMQNVSISNRSGYESLLRVYRESDESQEKTRILGSLATCPDPDVVLEDHWDYISKTWGSGFLITRFISAVVSQFASYEKAKEVEEFFASRTKPSITRTLKQSVERFILMQSGSRVFRMRTIWQSGEGFSTRVTETVFFGLKPSI